MKKTKRKMFGKFGKIISAVLAVCMVMGATSVTAFAATLDQDNTSGSATVYYQAGQVTDDKDTEDPTDDVVGGTYTVSIPAYIEAAEVDGTPAEYDVTAKNVLIPYGTSLKVAVDFENNLKLADDNSVTIGYDMQAKQGEAALASVNTGATILAGLALGIENICVTSDGKFYENQNNLQQSLNKLAKLQRELSRKEKGSANYEKARIKVAKLHEHIANQRKDYLQKVTTDLIRNYDVLYMEDPEIKQVMQESDLALKIADASLYKFIFMLKYKAEYYGKRIIFVNKDVLLDANTYDVEYLRSKAEEILYAGLDQQQDELLAA